MYVYATQRNWGTEQGQENLISMNSQTHQGKTGTHSNEQNKKQGVSQSVYRNVVTIPEQ